MRRIQTSYVVVEPKKRKEYLLPSAVTACEESEGSPRSEILTSTEIVSHPRQYPALDTLAVAANKGQATLDHSAVSSVLSPGNSKFSAGSLRRARIVITLQRTEAYTKWLEENPIQDIISGEDDDRT